MSNVFTVIGEHGNSSGPYTGEATEPCRRTRCN